MPASEIKVGDVLQFPSNQSWYAWVVGIDELRAQTIGSSWLDPREFHKRPLAMMSYGPLARTRFSSMTVVDHVPLNARELKAHRPDLPQRILCRPGFNWSQLSGMSQNEILNWASSHGWDLPSDPVLETSDLVLALPPKAGGWRKATKFSALGGRGFTAAELLSKAALVFEQEGVDVDDGIGIHRAGINRKCPFYLVQGVHDLAGISYMSENPDSDFEDFWRNHQWKIKPAKPSEEFRERLLQHRKRLPFLDWSEKQNSGMEQYTAKSCAAVQRVFTQLVDALLKCGESASADTKGALFGEAMQKLNHLHERVPELIETEEVEQLCAEFDSLAELVGLHSKSSENSESSPTAGRLW